MKQAVTGLTNSVANVEGQEGNGRNNMSYGRRPLAHNRGHVHDHSCALYCLGLPEAP
ncbi:hypothetical protein C8T65DRAFT_250350 [Cerioporus squamosus]|nr:hypothetical protein C8T65DRAFT_250350 [Cerioporus squamosus]